MKDIFIERTEAPEKNAEVFQNFTFYSTDKYTHDIYYISPLYHLEFPAQLKRVIVTDLDLEFRIDLAELWGHFSQFSATEVIGIGPDLHPHYFINTKEYRESNPGTHVGSPGRFQVGMGMSTKCSTVLVRVSTRAWCCITWRGCGRVRSTRRRCGWPAWPPSWTGGYRPLIG